MVCFRTVDAVGVLVDHALDRFEVPGDGPEPRGDVLFRAAFMSPSYPRGEGYPTRILA
jgi:hypothetical protein